MNEAQTLPKQLPGSVHRQWVKCGKPWCHCMKQGTKHGPYHYWFRREAGRLVKQYIKATNLGVVRAAIAARREEERRQQQVSREAMRFIQDRSQYLRDHGL